MGGCREGVLRGGCREGGAVEKGEEGSLFLFFYQLTFSVFNTICSHC